MLVSGTVVADPSTTIEDGAVVTTGDTIAFVGSREEAVRAYPSHERRSFDIVAPGFVGGHVHSVQSLGRGIADDTELLDWLFEHVLPMEADMDEEAMGVAATLGYLECIASGTTTVIDHLSVDHPEAAFQAAGDVGIRARMGKVLMDRGEPPALIEDTDEALAHSERLIEEYHGSHGGRLRYAVTPRFALSCTEACLRGTRDLADRHEGVRIHTHASENRDEIRQVETERGMTNIEWLHETGLTGPDVILAHCVWTSEAERTLLAETDTNVVYCPSSNMKLASGVAPIPDYLDRGITVALGNDGPPCNNTLDPFTEMARGSLLAKVETGDPTRLDARTVLEMATVSGARAAGFEDVGRLREGWSADLIGISTAVTRATPVNDVRSHLVFAAHGDDVDFTMIDGTVGYDGEATQVDGQAVRARARELAREI